VLELGLEPVLAQGPVLELVPALEQVPIWHKQLM
jgi:hypothetical protein